MRFAALALMLSATVASAGSDLSNLSSAERAAMGREIRALLLDEPEIIDRAMNPPDIVADAMRENVDADLALIDGLAPRLFAGADIALIVGENCPDCERAVDEIKEISETYGTTFKLHVNSDPVGAEAAAALGVDDLPFYVLPDMVLRGHIPSIVLEKYLSRR